MVLPKKKIKKIYSFLTQFFKKNLPHIVFLVFSYQLLYAVGGFPYFNIINRYYFYMMGVLWIFVLLLFSEQITNRNVLKLAFAMFILAIPATILELIWLSDALGFFAFIFIATFAIRQIIAERKQLL